MKIRLSTVLFIIMACALALISIFFWHTMRVHADEIEALHHDLKVKQTELKKTEVQLEESEQDFVNLREYLAPNNWQVYQNDKYSFRMMVPRDWKWENYRETDEDMEERRISWKYHFPDIKEIERIEGILFYGIDDNGERQRKFLLQVFSKPHNWSLLKFWAITAGPSSEEDFEGEKYVGFSESSPERFLLPSTCLHCINPYLKFDERHADFSSLIQISDKLVIKFNRIVANTNYITQTIHTF